ncbi:MAG: methyltransferase domain-containing protein [Desulfobacteraceae bacterium]|nr:methyltransferase domain-containing protein [Desulfobacteraceae bacterium]
MVKKMTSQLEFWKSDFGFEYSLRDRNRISKENIQKLHCDWGKILSRALTPYPKSALEVGCNIGRNLIVLQNYLDELHAVEPNAKACRAVRENKILENVVLHESDGFSLPYSDNSIDMVFTSGVLIHVCPDDLKKMIQEIYRVSKYYIVCIEYFAHEPREVSYHGKNGLLFKRDFGGLYLDTFPSLTIVDYGFLWQRFDSSDNSHWWLFKKNNLG